MKKDKIQVIIAVLIFFIAFVFNFNNILINNILYLISYGIVGRKIVFKAIRNIFRGKIFD